MNNEDIEGGANNYSPVPCRDAPRASVWGHNNLLKKVYFGCNIKRVIAYICNRFFETYLETKT